MEKKECSTHLSVMSQRTLKCLKLEKSLREACFGQVANSDRYLRVSYSDRVVQQYCTYLELVSQL